MMEKYNSYFKLSKVVFKVTGVLKALKFDKCMFLICHPYFFFNKLTFVGQGVSGLNFLECITYVEISVIIFN